MSLASLEAPEEPVAVPAVLPRVTFEVSDLFYYYASGSTPTGIQRVQQELCLELLRRQHPAVTSIVVYDKPQQKWRIVSREWLRSLVNAARSFKPGAHPWQKIYQEFAAQLAVFPVKHFEAGEWLLNIGASWGLPSYFVQVRQLRRQGVRLAIFLHDCIPARHPAYFDHSLSIEHTYWLAQIRETADVVICNSEATRSDYLELVKPPHPEAVYVCRLDASWSDYAITAEADMTATELLADIGASDDQFVLCVGTVEPRKNHLSLIHVWDKLRQTHRENCPKLICVGRIGWKSDAIVAQAKALGLLDNKIYFLQGLSDEVLQALYRRCLFTIYVSYYEGWGLPISESLAAGKVCIAGTNSSLPEAGAGYAIHVDERSETSIHEAVTRLLDHPNEMDAISERIQKCYRARTWGEIADDLTGVLGSAGESERAGPELPQLRVGTFYRFGRSEALKQFDQPEAAERFFTGYAWHQPEPWGVWTSKESAELAFSVHPSEEQLPTIFIGLKPPPGAASVTVAVNGKQVLSLGQFTTRRIVRIQLQEEILHKDEKGLVPIRLRISASRVQNMKQIENSKDTRILGIGYFFLVGIDRSSIFERLDFLERMLTNEMQW